MQEAERSHFQGKDPVVKKIYDKLVSRLKEYGPIKIEPKKTSIHLANRFGFAGVYTRSNYMILEIHLNQKLENARVTKVEQASANRFHHTFRITSEKEIDKELLAWLREAYLLKA